MILKIKRYFSAYNEYCEVSVEGAYIYMKLRIGGTGNREPGTGSLFLNLVNVSDISTLLIGNRKSGTGNRELVPCSLFWYVIPIFLKCKSGIRNQFPVPF